MTPSKEIDRVKYSTPTAAPVLTSVRLALRLEHRRQVATGFPPQSFMVMSTR
jgi:hypothetical protein